MGPKENFGYLADNAVIRNVETSRIETPVENDDNWVSAEDADIEMSDAKWDRFCEGF